MPRDYDPPLPPLPADELDLAKFIREHRPSDVATLILELHACDIDCQDDVDLLRVLGDEICLTDPRYGAAVAEIIFEHPDPYVRRLILYFFEGLLGRGLDRMEQILWDELLNSSDDQVFLFAYEELHGLVEERVVLSAGSYSDVYGRREQWTHRIKLGRVRARYEKLSASRPATSE